MNSTARCELMYLELSTCDQITQDTCYYQVWSVLTPGVMVREMLRGNRACSISALSVLCESGAVRLNPRRCGSWQVATHEVVESGCRSDLLNLGCQHWQHVSLQTAVRDRQSLEISGVCFVRGGRGRRCEQRPKPDWRGESDIWHTGISLDDGENVEKERESRSRGVLKEKFRLWPHPEILINIYI